MPGIEGLVQGASALAVVAAIITFSMIMIHPILVFRERVKDDASLKDKLEVFPQFYRKELAKVDGVKMVKVLCAASVIGYVIGGLIYVLGAGIQVILT